MSIIHICVENKISGAVADGKVVLRQLGLGGVEGHLVAEEPALVAHGGGGVHQGAAEVHVHVGVDRHQVVLVLRLHLAVFLAAKKGIGPLIRTYAYCRIKSYFY